MSGVAFMRDSTVFMVTQLLSYAFLWDHHKHYIFLLTHYSPDGPLPITYCKLDMGPPQTLHFPINTYAPDDPLPITYCKLDMGLPQTLHFLIDTYAPDDPLSITY